MQLHFPKHQQPILPGRILNIVEIKGSGISESLRIYPRNTPEILINLGEPLKGTMENRLQIVRNTTIQGSKTSYMDVEHPEQCHFISIRFTTNGFYKLFGVPQDKFTDQLYSLDEVFDQPEGWIKRLINESGDREDVQDILNELHRLNCKQGLGDELLSDFIIEKLSRNPTLTVKELVDKTGYTRKHLAERFKEEAGLTIKTYQRIQRIYHILKLINQEHSLSWTRLAYRFGFYDQSHLIRDFKRLTGSTPTRYSRAVS